MMKRQSLQSVLITGVIVVIALVCMGCASLEMAEQNAEPDLILDTSGNIVMGELSDIALTSGDALIIKEVNPDVLEQESISAEDIFYNIGNHNEGVLYKLTGNGTSVVYFVRRVGHGLRVYRQVTETERQEILAGISAERQTERQEAALVEQQEREQEEARAQAEAETNRQQQPPDDDFMVTQNNDNTVTITNYRGTAKNIIIPSTLYGLRVTAIGARAFREKELIGVVIPNTVTTIGERAFEECANLRAVTIGNAVKTIGNGAFNNTALTEIVIPNSVTAIGDEAFSTCSSLQAVTIGNAVKTIGSRAFIYTALTEIVIPDSVTNIGSYAFTGANSGRRIVQGVAGAQGRLIKVQLGRSLKIIGGEAFANNRIRELVIPNGVTYIGQDAFSNQLTELVIPPSLVSYAEEGRIQTAGITRTAFGGSPITRITLPANMDDRNMLTFEENLRNFYKNQNKAAGVYVKNGPIWTRQ